MKRLLVIAITIFMLIASMAVYADDQMILIDFSKEPTFKSVKEDKDQGDIWTISWEDGLAFMGKYEKSRIAFTYDEEEEACKFIAITRTGVFDPYFVSSEIDKDTMDDMPEKYHIDTSEYKYIKILYKAKSDVNSGGVFWKSKGVPSDPYDDYYSRLFFITGDDTWREVTIDMSDDLAWENAGTVSQIRLNIFRSQSIADEDYMLIKHIAFFKTKEAADKYTKVEGTPIPTATKDPNEATTEKDSNPLVKYIVFGLIILVLAVVLVIIIVKKKRS